MKKSTPRKVVRCAIYTRKSTEEGLEQAFNSLDAQRESCEAYITSQSHENWQALPEHYDDGGFSGGNVERPALKALLEDIRDSKIDLVIVYKVDRLSRSLADFVRLIELLDQHNVSFVSVTQQFNTAHSMGRLTLNVLLSFAQFEREVTSERIRDKIAASKKKGMWMGGTVPLGYDVVEKKLVVNASEARSVNILFEQYLQLKSVRNLKHWADKEGLLSKQRVLRSGKVKGGIAFTRSSLYAILKNPLYLGKIRHETELYEGSHKAIVDRQTWEQAQQQIETNRVAHYHRTEAKNPGLLAGLIFDDKDNPMSPTHTQRRNMRFRYYVSQALLKYNDSEAGSVQRVPAEPIEQAIFDELNDCLDHPLDLLRSSDTEKLTIEQREHISAISRELQVIFSSDNANQKIPALNQLISCICVSKNAISIKIESENLAKLFELPAPEQPYTIERTIAATLRRTGIEKRLVLDGKFQKAHPRSVEALQRATLTALNVNQALLTGAVDSIKTIAKKDNADERNLGHLLKLAFLSPDTISRIANGEVSADEDLQLTALKQRKSPLIWQ